MAIGVCTVSDVVLVNGTSPAPHRFSDLSRGVQGSSKYFRRISVDRILGIGSYWDQSFSYRTDTPPSSSPPRF